MDLVDDALSLLAEGNKKLEAVLKKIRDTLGFGVTDDERFGSDGYPLPNTPESVRVELYWELRRSGLSDAETRGTVWPE